MQGAYAQNQPQVQGIADQLYGKIPGLMDSAFETSPLVRAGTDYATDVLGGKYLGAGNPYLDAIINRTGGDVADRVNATFSRAGRTGSTTHAQDLTRGLADSENQLRYQNYDSERARMMQALGLSPQLESQKYAGIAPLLALSQGAAGLPWIGAGNLASGIGSLVGNSQTQTSTPSTASSIQNGLGTAFQLASLFSDRRLKRTVRKLGEMADGLGVYIWRYVWGGPEVVGVMADEVEKLRPWALGPVIGGYATVNYEALQ